jgi:hypothetical protein
MTTAQPAPGQAKEIALTDARALRAYAHPIRMRLVGLLRTEGPLTATRAAALLGESSGTTSFHLRQLAKYGLVEEAGGGTGRQKPWQATALFTRLPEIAATPELADASAQVHAVIADRYHQMVLEWIARGADEPEAWRRATPFSDYLLYLTVEEMAELGERIDALLLAYADRIADKSTRPAGSRLVTYLNLAMPHATLPEPEPEPAP